VGYSLLTLSRDLKQIQLLAPGSPLLCPKAVAYDVIDNFFFSDDWRDPEKSAPKRRGVNRTEGKSFPDYTLT
jgi:hypothetical protein